MESIRLAGSKQYIYIDGKVSGLDLSIETDV